MMIDSQKMTAWIVNKKGKLAVDVPLEKVRVRSDQIRSRNSAAFTRAGVVRNTADGCKSCVMMMRIDDWPISISNRPLSMMPGWEKATAEMTRLRQM